MKIRNLLSKYCNLQPQYVCKLSDEADSNESSLDIYYSHYKKLYYYTVQLEAAHKHTITRNNELLHELRMLNKALMRKHRRVTIIKEFLETFKDFKEVFNARRFL